LAKTNFNLAKSLFLPLVLLAFVVLLAIFEGRRKETPMEYPYGYTTRVLVDESIGIINSGTAWDPSISADGRFVAFHAEVVFKKKPTRTTAVPTFTTAKPVKR
jgi:hypothetical protein